MATTTRSSKRNKSKEVSNDLALSAGPGGPWSSAAPGKLRESYLGPQSNSGWSVWRTHLAKRKLRALGKHFPGRQPALFWAVPSGGDLSSAERIVELLRNTGSAARETSALENAANQWLKDSETAEADSAFGLECLAWAGALPALGEHLSESTWWTLCNHLVAIAADERRATEPLSVQLLHVELPVLLAYCLPELAECQSLISVARHTLEQSTVELLGEGSLLHGTWLETLRPLLACWTRCRILSRTFDPPLWTEEVARQYCRVLEYALRLTRADGRQALSPTTSPSWNRRLLKTALRLANRAKTRRLAELLEKGDKSEIDARRSPWPALELEAAGVAVLRSNWRRRSPQLVVNHSSPQFASELRLGKALYWSGVHELEIRIDGQEAASQHAWDQLCWTSDEDVDYLELELDLSHGVRVQRLIALARKDNFLFLGDAVLSDRPAKIEYRSTLPLAMGASFQGAQETREGLINSGQHAALRVLPLGLGEWRCGSTCGSLQSTERGLQLAQTAQGEALFAPLVIDLDPRRLTKEVTWRQLTVGRNRNTVPQDEAVGYRAQVGRVQWLFYRALGMAATRTVLGRNLYNELLIGRFQMGSGKIETILEIEA